jgi:hypothetical protein
VNDPGEGRGRFGGGRGLRWLRAALLVFAATLISALLAAPLLLAQDLQSGSIEGKLTDLYSKPLDGARVVLRNVRTGAEFATITGRSGAYRLVGMAPGAYVLEAQTEKVGVGHASGIVIRAGYAAKVQTAVALTGQSLPAWQAARTTRLGIPALAPLLETARESAPATETSPSAAALPAAIPQNTAAVKPIAFTSRVTPSGEADKIAAAEPPASMNTASQAMTATMSATMRGTGMILVSAAAASARTALQMQAAMPRRIEQEANQPEPPDLAVTTTLSSEELQALPLNGRAFEEAASGAPPEAAPVEAEERDHPAQRERGGGVLDGIDTRMMFQGRGAGRRSGSSILAPGVTEANIRSMRADDAGGVSSKTTRLETRSGADTGPGRLRGNAFFFDRSTLLGARNPFTEWTKETAPPTATTVPAFAPFAWSPADRRARWGLGLGGPLKRDRLFWFAAFENQMRDDPAVSSVKHPDNFFAQPSNDEMQVLSARLGLSSKDPVTEGRAAYSAMLESLAGLLGPAPRTSVENTAFARVDWKAAQRHRFTLEATGAQWDAPGGGLTRASESYGSHSFGASRGSETWIMARWEAFLKPNLLAETQASMGRHILTHAADTPSPFEQALNVNPWGQLPQMVVDSRYGFTIGNPARFGAGSYPDERSYQARENLEWIRGGLALHAGFEVRHDEDATGFVRNHTGTYHYARVENFASDALVFAKFGLTDALDPMNQHNCDERGKAWRDSDGQLHGLGYLPCYSYYTQTAGPTQWHLETTDLAGYTTAQWRPRKTLVLSAGIRWERQETPSTIPLVNNPDLPLSGKLPSLGNEFAPHLSLAWGTHESHWPMVRLGYGMLYGRTSNSVLETALTQTGSAKGNVDLFLRPTDNLPGKTGGAPPFPYVLAGTPGATVKPGAVEVASTFRNPEVQQGMAAVEEELPGRVLVSVNAVAALGRRLPVTIDTNFDPTVNPGTITYEVVDATGKGPITTPMITVPFFASWPADAATSGRLNPNYQQITEMMSRANSTYEAAILQVSRAGRRGFSFNARYTYGHATDWNPDEGALRARASVLDPLDFRQEYGTSNLDLRHSASGHLIWQSPWKLGGAAGQMANGWMLSGIAQYHSGLPYTMRTAGSLAQEFESGGLVMALGPGMNGYGGANRVYGVGRNTYRYPATWKADVRLGKRIPLGHQRDVEMMAQSFNLFNHQNVTELETVGYYVEPGSTSGSLPRLNFLTGLKTGQTEFGWPLNVNATDYYRERQFEFGIRLRFKHDIVDQ